MALADRERVVVEVNGKRLEVVVPGWLAGAGVAPGGAGRAGRQRRARRTGRCGLALGGGRSRREQASAADGDTLVSPMQGTIVKIVAAEGQAVQAGETIVVLEAMKMEQPLTAHKAGTVSELAVEVGQTVSGRLRHLQASGLIRWRALKAILARSGGCCSRSDSGCQMRTTTGSSTS